MSRSSPYGAGGCGLRCAEPGIFPEEARKRAKDALCQLGLEGFEERAPQYLSGGEKKRVTIAGVLAMEPKVLLLDEPAAALDPQGAWELEGLLEKLHQKGLTLMVATHDVDFAYGWADRCLVMEKGRLLADLPPWELFKKEELLEKAHLRPPFLFRAARALGMEEHPPRTIEELEQRIKERNNGTDRTADRQLWHQREETRKRPSVLWRKN